MASMSQEIAPSVDSKKPHAWYRFLVIAVLISGLAFGAANAKECHVKGDTSKNQTSKPLGSSANPYGSLAAVEADPQCDTIRVLYSSVALDGGIELKDGQELFGEKGPKNRLPVLTNSTASNDGHGIILALDNTISGIHIDQTEKSGISGNAVGKLVIEDIRISRFASNGVLYAPLPGALTGAPIPASGVEILSTGDAQIHVSDSDIGEADASSFIVAVLSGHADIDLERVTIHDQGHHPGAAVSPGIAVIGFDTASADVRIIDSSVSNIGGGDSNSDGIGLLVSQGSSMTALIDGYNYDNPDADGGGSATGMEIGTFWGTGATFEAMVKNSVIRGSQAAGIQLLDYAPGNSNNVKIDVVDNEIYESRQGVQVLIFGPDNSTQVFTIANNLIVDPWLQGIQYVAAINYQDVTDVMIEKNTIENAPVGMQFHQEVGSSAATLRLDAGLGALGSIGRNRIVNSQDADIVVLTFDCCGFPETPAYHVDAANNWWGSSEGPSVVIEQGLATVDVTPFLMEDPAF